MNWKKLLESISESVNNHLRLRNDYLVAENRLLCNQIDGRMRLTDNERQELAEIGVQLGKQVLAEIATVATPATILAWYRTVVNQKVDPSELPQSVGRPRVDKAIEDLVVRMARENRTWGYDRIQGSLKHLGYTISDQTVGNILKRHRIPPAPKRKKTTTWREFVRFHLEVLRATDFFNSEVWNWFGLLISSCLSFLHFSRPQGHAVGMLLHRQLPGMQSVLMKSRTLRAYTQRWGYWVKILCPITDDSMWHNPPGESSRCGRAHRGETTSISRDEQGDALV